MILTEWQIGIHTTLDGSFMYLVAFRPLSLFQTLKRPALRNIDEKLAVAEARRKELSEEKVKSVLERTGLQRQERLKSASQYERQKIFSASVEKRQKQLQDIRDRLVNTTTLVLIVAYFRDSKSEI